MSPDSFTLYLVVAIPFVFCKNDPSALCDERKPILIWCSTRKVIAVASVLNAVGYQGFNDGLAVVQIFIQVQDEIVKLQLLGFPSGLPLRSAFLRGHIP